MSGLVVNGQHYDILGNNLYRNTKTNEVVDGRNLHGNIHVGSGNNMAGANIGNTSVTLFSPSVKFRGWDKLLKTVALLGIAILVTGAALACFPPVPLAISVCLIVGGTLALINSLFKITLQRHID